MPEPWSAIKVAEFEFAVISPAEAILRVRGKWRRRRDAANRPAMVVHDSAQEHRFSAIASPADRGRGLRAAYAVPLELVKEAHAFALELDSGARINLPIPEPGQARLTREAASEDGLTPGARRRQELLIGELEENHAVALEEAEKRVAVALEEAQKRVAAAEDRAAEAQQQTAAAQREAAQARESAAEVERGQQGLSHRFTESQASVESLLARVAELEESERTLRAKLSETEGRLNEALGSRQPLEVELDRLRSTRSHLESQLEEARDQVHLITMERDELSRQATAYDEVAVKARERAQRAEEAHAKSSSALEEIQVWRGELQRRLAAMTTELRTAQDARETDQRELNRLRTRLAEHDEADLGRDAVDTDSAQALTDQAAEIERLAAELAALRAQGAPDGEQLSSG